MGKLERVAGALGAVGVVLSAVFVTDPQTGLLAQVKLGPFALWDRRRWEARQARRAARRRGVPLSEPPAPPAPMGTPDARSSDPDSKPG